ncbi:unnamed protein product, partial [Darwinula stevensoni]
RHFKNTFPDGSLSEGHFLSDTLDLSGGLLEEFRKHLGDSVYHLILKLQDAIEHDPSTLQDVSVYTGIGGIAYLYLHLGLTSSRHQHLLKEAEKMVDIALEKGRLSKRPSFLCGDVGLFCVAAVLYKMHNRETDVKKMVQLIENFHPVVIDLKSGLPDEILYGRSGYLYALLYLNKHLGGIIQEGHIMEVVQAILASGKRGAHESYEVLKSQEYLEPARKASDVVWERGLLTKGYGICHGVAGNAYTFLSVYEMTHDPNQLHRTAQFAKFCSDYGKHGCRHPDRPLSLFEGLAGTIYFLNDLQNPSAAKFPAFAL